MVSSSLICRCCEATHVAIFSYRSEQGLAPMSLHVLSCSLMSLMFLLEELFQKGYHNTYRDCNQAEEGGEQKQEEVPTNALQDAVGTRGT